MVLYDGDSMDAYMIGRYCGTKAPYPIVSSANQLYMVFKSDSSVQRKGFHASHITGMKYFIVVIKNLLIQRGNFHTCDVEKKPHLTSEK